MRNLFIFICFLTTFPLCGQTISGKSKPVDINITSGIVNTDEARPEIVWLYPDASKNSIDERNTQIKVGILSKSRIKQVTLLLNDVVVSTYRNFNQARQIGYQFDAFVQSPLNLIQGINKVELVVQNELDVILKHKRNLIVAPPVKDRSDLALLFAFDEYDYLTGNTGSVADSEKLAQKLNDFGFKIEILRNPTTFEVLAKMEEYSEKRYKLYDQLFIYFAGQGEFDERLGGGYLACKNSKKVDPDKKTHLPFSLIRSIANNIPVAHILVTMDVCRDDTLEKPLRLQLKELEGDKPVAASASNQWVEGLLNQKSRLFLTTGYDRSTNAEHNPSTFTQSYLNAFDAAKEGSVLTLSDLLKHFSQIQPEPQFRPFGDNVNSNGFIFELKQK